MRHQKRILIIGATGHFGERIAKRLLGEPNTELLVSSRSLQKASQLAKALSQINNSYPVSAIAIDYQSDSFETELEAAAPDIVIHTAGPYQGQSYRVAKACINIGSHYIDLADGREFVEGFHELNTAATVGSYQINLGDLGMELLGAQAVDNRIPLITNDNDLRDVVNSMGGTAN